MIQHNGTRDWIGIPAGGVVCDLTLFPDSPILGTFYAGYDAAFALPDEKETLQGFRDCLALNLAPQRQSLGREFGDFAEAVLIARDTAGTAIGGANFITSAITHDDTQLVTMNLNYIFAHSAQRGKGYLAAILQAVRGMARQLCGAPAEARVLIFLEQNDPVRMDPAAYRIGSAHSGIDQKQRIATWTRHGARIVDFAYVQPPLSPAQQPDDALVYAVIGTPWTALPACLLHQHLRRFFGISVLKGRPLSTDVTSHGQIEHLAAQCARAESIALLDPTPWLSSRAPVHLPPGSSLRDALRTHAHDQESAR